MFGLEILKRKITNALNGSGENVPGGLTQEELSQAEFFREYLDKARSGRSVITEVCTVNGEFVGYSQSRVPLTQQERDRMKSGFSDACGWAGWSFEKVFAAYEKVERLKNRGEKDLQ